MDLDSLFKERDIARATRKLEGLERYAEARAGFIAALDFAQLSANEKCAILTDDEALCETLAFGQLYLDHLADLAAHAPELLLAA